MKLIYKFFKLLQIFQNFSNILIQKNLHVSRPTQFKAMLFKDQMYLAIHRFEYGEMITFITELE